MRYGLICRVASPLGDIYSEWMVRGFSVGTLVCVLLCACGAPTAPPLPSPTLPAPSGPAPTDPDSGGNTPAASYPYNPDASAVQSGDARVPYYGEWVWVVTFSNQSTFNGKMGVSVRERESASFKNGGVGVSQRCLAGLDACQYADNRGSINTYLASGGGAYLSADYYDTTADELKWVGLDADGRVGSEVSGKPTITGTGRWYFTSGGSASVGFALVQVGTEPAVKLGGALAPPPVAAGRPAAGTGLNTQAAGALQARAIAAASALVAGR